MLIPERAIEAAARAILRERAFSAAAAFGVPMDEKPECSIVMAAAALEAAAPIIAAQALRDAAVDWMAIQRTDDHLLRQWLSARANQIDPEGGTK